MTSLKDVKKLAMAVVGIAFLLMQTVSGQAQGQGAASGSLSFEVASIKPSKGDGTAMAIEMTPGGRFSASGVTLALLIMDAYGVKDYQVVGLPGWAKSDHYDIVAKAEGGQPVSRDQMWLMLRSLLADRFKLFLHSATREVPIYVLAIEKNGPKIQRSKVQPGLQVETSAGRSNDAANSEAPKLTTIGSFTGRRQLSAHMITMSGFAASLGHDVGRPVVDRTDLKGFFDFKLEWAPDIDTGALGPDNSQADSAPSLFTALKEQLGLRLESARGPGEVLIIDRVERPSEN